MQKYIHNYCFIRIIVQNCIGVVLYIFVCVLCLCVCNAELDSVFEVVFPWPVSLLL